MIPLAAIHLVIIFLSTQFSLDVSAKSPNECQMSGNQRKFDVLPGSGWDNLENVEKGRVLYLNYSNCKFSQDNMYLIPNHVSITPNKESKMSLQSELIDQNKVYKSMTAGSINLEASGTYHAVTVSGSFSFENSRAKDDQTQTKSTLSRVQLRYNVFTSMFQPDAMLDPTFKNRLLDIAGLIISGKDYIYAQYLADMMVRDYGTHFIRSKDVGAVLAKTDALNSAYTKQFEEDSTKISTSATVSYLKSFDVKVGGETNFSTTDLDEYTNNCVQSRIDTFGGTVYGQKFTIEQWQQSVMTNLVAIDRRGDPLNFVITPKVLPELDIKIIQRLSKLIEDAIGRYYTINTRTGCKDMHSPNFNPGANVDSNDCQSPESEFAFGGIYQTCDKDNYYSVIHNPLTGLRSCPPGFRAILVFQEKLTWEEYHFRFIFLQPVIETATRSTYWCAPLPKTDLYLGLKFGGFYSDIMNNPVTNTKGCPSWSVEISIPGFISVCYYYYPNKDELSPKKVFDFGGIYSCLAGNPLADHNWASMGADAYDNKDKYWSKKCPPGYSPNIMAMTSNCTLTYCSTQSYSFVKPSNQIRRPPFIQISNATKVSHFANEQGYLFVKESDGSWQSDGNWFRANRDIFISAGSSIGVALLVSFVVLMVQRNRIKKKGNAVTTYTQFQNSALSLPVAI